jgi:O-methyltransferase involved in polyketide biosynthesis
MSDALDRFVAHSGEPIKTRMTAVEVEALLQASGLALVENLTREQLHDRYFAERTDGLTPHTLERVLTAEVVAARSTAAGR